MTKVKIKMPNGNEIELEKEIAVKRLKFLKERIKIFEKAIKNAK